MPSSPRRLLPFPCNTRSTSKDLPSSFIFMQMPSGSFWMLTSTRLACAWRATLVSASWATRKEHRPPGDVQLFHPRKGRQVSADARPLGKDFHERMQGGNQPQVVQHRRAQFAGELMHDVHRFFHQPLRAGDVAVQALGVGRGLLFQGRQPDIDARQGLGDDIMQFAADFPAFLLLGQRESGGTTAAIASADDPTVPATGRNGARFF